MKKLIFLLTATLLFAMPKCGTRLGSGNLEAEFIAAGYHRCSNIEVVDGNLESRGEAVVEIKNHSNKEKKVVVLAGYVDSMSGRIGWACGTKIVYLDPREHRNIKVVFEALPFLSRRWSAKVFCK